MLCLDRARRELEALLGVIGRGDPSAIQNAAEATASLRPLSQCSDPDELRAGAAWNDPRLRDVFEELDARVAAINALRASGHYGEALEATRPLVARLEELDSPLFHAEFGVSIVNVYAQMGLAREAEEQLRRALLAAERAGLDRRRAQILVEHVFVVGNLEGDHRRAQWFARAAHAVLDRVGGREYERGDLLTNEAVIEILAGNTARGIEIAESVLSRRAEYGLDEDENVAALLANLGSAHFTRGDYERALEYYLQGYELRKRAFGPDHPAVALSMENAGNALTALGRLEEALSYHRGAYELALRARIGDGHRTGVTLNNIAVTLHELGRTDEAATYWEKSRRIWQEHDPGHVAHGIVLCNLGEVDRLRGDHGSGHGRYVEALEILEESAGPRHMYTALAWMGLGRALNDLGRHVEAREALDRSSEIAETVTLEPLNSAELDFQRGRALWIVDPDRRDEALSLARGGLERLGPLGGKAARVRAEMKRWLRDAERTRPGTTPR
jgi:eukaryotic-like serine/threonine-protein kinase